MNATLKDARTLLRKGQHNNIALLGLTREQTIVEGTVVASYYVATVSKHQSTFKGGGNSPESAVTNAMANIVNDTAPVAVPHEPGT